MYCLNTRNYFLRSIPYLKIYKNKPIFTQSNNHNFRSNSKSTLALESDFNPSNIKTLDNSKPESTVKRGKDYESLVVRTLGSLGAILHEIGGANDQGIDFRGSWTLSASKQLYVVGQCKNYQNNRVGPSVVREFDGVLSRQSEVDTVGVISCPIGFTKKAVDAAMSSKYPVCLLTIKFPSKHNNHEIKRINGGMESNLSSSKSAESGESLSSGKLGNITGFLWNAPANRFLGDVIVTSRYSKTTDIKTANINNLTIILNNSVIY
ncbi:hypothetical protein BB559_000977 [Furculomyces boomerangus]|uniref:Restriction endonuclease type IV Mrr domain-containing protein n=1 Tax=Furculomyces boomerangus TaxID=61424 RepID=A0A2T9Z3H3_9FUNG|nr:hypothetical protein BB559_000977 [Furculomyces boomerangus]